MRKGLVVGIGALAVGFATVFGGSLEARAQECDVTQGAYAIALAQALGFDVGSADAAISALAGITPPEGGIAPTGGWQPDLCATADVVAQIRDDLKLADPRYGAGSADRVFGALSSADRRSPVSPFKP